MTTSKTTRLTLSGAASLLALSLAAGNACAEEKQFDIEAQPLAKALLEFNEQSGLTVAAPRDLVQGKNAPAVSGAMEPDEALEKILSGSGLISNELPTGAFTITLASAEATEPAPEPFRVAQLDQEEGIREVERREEVDDEEDRQDVIIVTGTNIRGIAPDSSPTRTFTREDIQFSGVATAQDFVQTMPENFGGGSNESFATAPGNRQAGTNDAIGSSVNLRGLGAGSTLVLLDGRRIAPSSDIGGFTDISMIPASAIERVEVLTDGASSIYGGDAVAGVVNFVLRDDFEGVESAFRYGVGTQNGTPDEYRASLTGGTNWESGNGLIVYEYYQRDNLDNSDRSFSDEFMSPNDLLAKQERHSVFGSLSQQLAPNLEFGASVLFSKRDSNRTITSLLGSSTGRVSENDVSNTNFNIGSNLSWNFASDWFLDLSGNYSELNTDSDRYNSDNTSLFRKNKAESWAVDAKSSGTIFDLPGGPAKIAVGGHYRQESFLNVSGGATRSLGDRDVYAVFGEVFLPLVGADNAQPGIQRLEINASGRFEDYSDFGSKATPKIGLLWGPTDELNFRGSYSESYKPPALGLTGALDRLGVALPTSFIYTVFEVEPADPSIADVVMLNISGTSENLDAETSRAFTGGFDYDADFGRHGVTINTTYFDIVFENRLSTVPVPEGQDVFLIPNIAFDSPELFPEGTVTFFPTPDELAAALDSLIEPPDVFFGADPSDAQIISYAAITRNLSRTEVRGIDFNAAYSYEDEIGTIRLGIGGTYLTDFNQQADVTTPLVQLLDTQFNPLNLNLRGNLGYSRDRFNANLFVNYADDYRVDNTDTGERIGSWTTVDLSLSYNTGERTRESLLSNTAFRLSVSNLFDEDPPSAPSQLDVRLLGFDPTNASPLGRFISFEVSKRF